MIITGGHETGGLASFADALASGFQAAGVPADIVQPNQLLSLHRALRDPAILKILSTTAVFAAPFAKRAICMAHGIPRVDAQGWPRLIALISSFKLANRCAGAQLVSVSHFTAATLRAMFAIRTDGVVHNPLKPLFLEPLPKDNSPRNCITYVGRLNVAKNIHRLIPAIKAVLDERSDLSALIIGDGKERARLQSMVSDDPRFQFITSADDLAVREYLRKTRLFVSGNEVEGFGIAYLEAMSQGCIVAMPGSGGGIEINPPQLGKAVRILPLSWEQNATAQALLEALDQPWSPVPLDSFTIEAAVRSYLAVDSKFLPGGIAPHD